LKLQTKLSTFLNVILLRCSTQFKENGTNKTYNKSILNTLSIKNRSTIQITSEKSTKSAQIQKTKQAEDQSRSHCNHR